MDADEGIEPTGVVPPALFFQVSGEVKSVKSDGPLLIVTFHMPTSFVSTEPTEFHTGKQDSMKWIT